MARGWPVATGGILVQVGYRRRCRTEGLETRDGFSLAKCADSRRAWTVWQGKRQTGAATDGIIGHFRRAVAWIKWPSDPVPAPVLRVTGYFVRLS